MLVNKLVYNRASDCLVALLPYSQKLCLKILLPNMDLNIETSC